MRANFQQSLEDLQREICKMGSMVEEMITDAINSLLKQDLELAEGVLQKDKIVNKLDINIQDICMKLIATQQPMGKDLRLIAITFNVVRDLERMGDHACDIAKTVTRIGKEPLIKALIDIPRMAELSKKMVKKSLDSYVAQDIDLAEGISQDDDQVDQLHNQIFRELLIIMFENPKTINQATHLIFISSSLERIADYATNICESIIFLVTGDRKDLNP